MPKTKSSRSPKPKKSSTRRPLYRRALYFLVMIMTGGTAGVGGWCFKDYPELQPIFSMFLGGSGNNQGAGERPSKLAVAKAVVAEVFARTPNKPGVYTVRINEVRLDPREFADGRTVDIQARVRRIDDRGDETTIWESKPFGQNLAVVGRDELSTGWANRPFEIDWRAGDQVIVEVWDREAGLFSPMRFRMAPPAPDAFPLASGTHALEVASRSRSAAESDLNRIVLDSRRAGDSASGSSRMSDAPERSAATARTAPSRRDSERSRADVAERPLIIR